jgi:hypothetical protein
MDKTEVEIQRGHRAQNLLKDDLWKEACDHVEAELFRLFKEVSPQDSDSLKHIKAMQYFHAKYQAFFMKCVTDGKIAQINLEAKKKSLKERVFG